MSRFLGVEWNLFLAVIPVVLAYTLAAGLGDRAGKRRFPLFVNIPLFVLWLLFLPNTCYLLTEWRHLLFDPRWSDILQNGDTNRHAMLSTAKWALFFLAYSGTGALLFVLAIRPLERWWRSMNGRPWIAAPFLFSLCSLGVYLGLIFRNNSWDAWQQPALLWQTTMIAVSGTTSLKSILAFAAILWALYEAADIWVDGASERLRRLGILPATSSSRSPK